MSRSPSLAEVLRAATDTALEGVYTSIVGKVVRYNAAKQQADVQPLIREAYEDETGERVAASLPVCVNCPVQMPRFGLLVITGPIKVGDTGMLMFSRQSLDKWLAGNGREVDPELDHKFSLSDAVFLPGVAPFGAPRKTAPEDYIAIGTDGGSFAGVAREGDTITIPFASLNAAFTGTGGFNQDVDGTITSASSDVKVT